MLWDAGQIHPAQIHHRAFGLVLRPHSQRVLPGGQFKLAGSVYDERLKVAGFYYREVETLIAHGKLDLRTSVTFSAALK